MKAIAAPVAALVLAGLSACGESQTVAATDSAEAAAPDPAALLDAVLAGDQRSAEERARDRFRHPGQTLQFFGVEPDMTVVEVWPGGGWYTNIIAPYLAAGGGTYYAAQPDPDGANERVADADKAFEKTYADKPDVYGTIKTTVLGHGHDIAPNGSADVVLTFRNVHNWMARGDAQDAFDAFYRALKPGGVLGVVEHRADPGQEPNPKASTGYVREDTVIGFAEAAGFELEAKSEINANPKDTKDHPFGVWTLPPVRRSSTMRGVEDPDFDRAKYDAIGESDRMTLKFRKPLAADGALLE